MAHLTKEFIKNMALAAREIAEAQEEKYGKDFPFACERPEKKLELTSIQEMKEWQGISDKEIAHIQADNILCAFLIELGFTDLVNEYKKIDKWYA